MGTLATRLSTTGATLGGLIAALAVFGLNMTSAAAQEVPPAARPGPDAAAAVRELGAQVLQPDAGRTVSGLALRVGPATLTLQEGELFPCTPVAGRPVQFVFVGSGRLESPAPDDIEAGQLELFTGRDHLDLTFEEAVLLAAGDAVGEALHGIGSAATNGSPSPPDAGRPPPEPAAAPEGADDAAARAAQLLDDWRDSTDRKRLAPEPALFLDAMGDRLLDGFFAAWLAGADEGDVLFTVDPRRAEALRVTHFVPDELEGAARRQTERALEREHRRGRMRGLELEDLGYLDVWMSSAVAPPQGVEWPARVAFEPRHYELDVRLARSDPGLRGTATIDLETVADGRRGLFLGLMPDLSVTSVRTAGGASLAFHQQRGDVAVALPAPSRTGDKLQLIVEYEGSPVDRVKHRTFALVSTGYWYPRAGEMDRATYDVTFHVPADLDLLAAGSRVEEEKNADEQRIRYALEYPAPQFSFEIGDFVVKEEKAGDVTVRVAYDRESSGFPAKVKREIQDTVRDALVLFGNLFGEYPLDELTVVLTPRPYSQGYLGFVTLSHVHVSEHGGWRELFWWLPDRRAFISHEIAHQWWGNLVGWKSYRDQWLSESLATWSAQAYMREQAEGNIDPEKGLFLDWTDALLDLTEGGRVVESLGPVVLGDRLDSSRYSSAYHAIVYQKGGMIMDLLARYAGDETFRTMLRQLVGAGAGRSLSTEEFIRAMERMVGRSLGWFRNRWVLGTGLPMVDYSYAFEPDPTGGWKVSMEALQRTLYYSAYRAVRTPQEGWDLERTGIAALPVKQSILPVEFQILTEGEGGGRKPRDRLERYGTTILRGRSSTFEVAVPTKPIRAWLDRREVAPARFFCETCEPKRTGLFRGVGLVTAGEWEAAESELLGALERPVFVPAEPGEGPTKPYLALRGRNLDGLIHLHLANLYLEQGRDADGAAAYARAMETMDRTGRWEVEDILAEIPTGPGADRSMYDPAQWYKRPQQWSALDFIDQVASRLEIRRGEYEAAYERLSKSLVVAQKNTRLKTRYVPRVRERSVPSLALLAIAAWETGRAEEAREALAKAEEGVDMSALKELIDRGTDERR